LSVVRKFARSVRTKIGAELYLLQIDELPVHRKPMATVGRGVWEIRIKDGKGAFRVFYVIRRREGIHVLHAFQKKTRKTSKVDIEIGKSRFRDLQQKN
ncbi:MAG: type II toxin-antitoxin system RelE/ParE family toxin, partial [Gammaproteobacteria bacterium]|nr:type II toxin-antitoxin system RelE/ParE family toxin [Gammaproteobacteria bacterium]NNL51758.1 type II toxin-antitoxin system RelE/ParE family toxin [Woeseiaceae bacterium]